MKHRRTFAIGLTTLIALASAAPLACVAGDWLLVVRVLAIVLLIWLPLVSIWFAVVRRCGTAMVLALLTIIPLYYARHAIPLPARIADAMIMALLLGLGLAGGGIPKVLRQWSRAAAV